MNKEQLTNILENSINTQTPLHLSQTTEMAECLDKVGQPTFTDKNNHDWKVMNGRQLKITLLEFPSLTDEINKIKAVSPVDYNVVTVSVQNLEQLVNDVSYSELGKPSFKAPLNKHLDRIQKALKRVANHKEIDTGFISMLITRAMSNNIPFDFLFKYPVVPAMSRLIQPFPYYDDVKGTEKEYDFE